MAAIQVTSFRALTALFDAFIFQASEAGRRNPGGCVPIGVLVASTRRNLICSMAVSGEQWMLVGVLRVRRPQKTAGHYRTLLAPMSMC